VQPHSNAVQRANAKQRRAPRQGRIRPCLKNDFNYKGFRISLQKRAREF
jgi:hypothetical protein